MIVSGCCKEKVQLIETSQHSYYSCSKCSRPSATMDISSQGEKRHDVRADESIT